MDESRRGLLAAMVLVIAVAVVASVVTRNSQADARTTSLTASGIIEADEVIVAAEVLGRIVALPYREGDRVAAGDVVARIDDSLIQLQITQAPDPATRRQLELQADRYQLHAPIAGVISRLPSRVGEIASPGQPIAALADLSQLDVTVYILERDLGRVAPRQSVSITADPYPGQAFAGVVTTINTAAEFTPRNIQTQRDRQNLVFGLKVHVGDFGGMLKPGMPVDVTFGPVPAS